MKAGKISQYLLRKNHALFLSFILFLVYKNER
jgi:hypothetical protein